MYHYIRDDSNLNCLTTEEFRRQVKKIKEKYKIITVEDLITEKPSYPSCCLTFDDGIKDGITNVLPILQEYNVNATFLIPMKILVNSKILSVQKRHLIASKIGYNKFIKLFNECVEEKYHIEELGIDYRYDSDLIASFKYILDYMDEYMSNSIIDKIFKHYFNEKEEFNKIYLNKDDLFLLKESGMEIGTHGFSHRYLGNLRYNDMETDIELSCGVYYNTFDKLPFTMSYPMGSYNKLLKRILRRNGYRAGITNNKNKNLNNVDVFELNRYDCIDKEVN